jgi:hypothetical protein
MITYVDIKNMSDGELALFAVKAPEGFSLVLWEDV